MKYKEVKVFESRQKSSEIIKLLEDFLKDGVKAAEITDYEDHYSSSKSLYTTVRTVTSNLFKGRVRCAKSGDHVYIERL